jgi:putative peptidoglycan lipid II flippase
MALAAGTMAATLWITQRLLFKPGDIGMGHGWRWAALAALVSLGGGAYLLAGQLFGAFDARDTLRLLSRRALRRREGSAISPTADP